MNENYYNLNLLLLIGATASVNLTLRQNENNMALTRHGIMYQCIMGLCISVQQWDEA
jgi:hypothetical protein